MLTLESGLTRSIFHTVFLYGQSYQTHLDEMGFKSYLSQINFATQCCTTACGILSKRLNI